MSLIGRYGHPFEPLRLGPEYAGPPGGEKQDFAVLRPVTLAVLLVLAPAAVAVAPPDLAGAALAAEPLRESELARLEAALAETLTARDEGRVDAEDAVADLFGATAASLAFVAAELAGGLEDSAPARAAAQDAYSEFAVAAQDRLVDALAALDEVRVNVRLEKRFTPFLDALPSGHPREAGWLASAAWSGAHGSGVIGAGYGTSAGGAEGAVRLVGPGGRDETVRVAFEPAPRQGPFRLITARFASDAAGPGDWRLELRTGADADAADIVQIEAP